MSLEAGGGSMKIIPGADSKQDVYETLLPSYLTDLCCLFSFMTDLFCLPARSLLSFQLAD